MIFDEKVQALNAKSLEDTDIIQIEIEPGVIHHVDCSRYDFVIWRDKRPFLYTREFIESHGVDEIKTFIDSVL